MFCSWCGSRKHTIDTCPKLAARQGRRKPLCSFCGKRGHSTDNCPCRHFNVRQRELERKQQDGDFDGTDLTD